MLSYETLDAIADAVNPVLLATSLLLPVIPAIRSRIALAHWYGLLIAALLVVYGLMFLDARLNLWPSFGADYSTHTAFATALISLWSLAGARWLFLVISILFAYIALMLYQGYHSVLDVVTTATLIAGIVAGMMRVAGQRAFPAMLDAGTG